MTRIIAGVAGGRSLKTPAGALTRPTSDRVREALFSALTARDVLAGAQVLDLYAGSGALGLEALSRGARHATFVEHDRKAAAVVRANLAALHLPGDVVQASAAAYVGRQGRPHDLVFLDPPYDVPEDALATVLAALAGNGWLAEGALVVVERSKRAPEPTWPAGWDVAKPRGYGETTLWYADC